MVSVTTALTVAVPLLSILLHLLEKEPHFEAYKQYGNPENPPLIIIPGLDGCTSFFSDVIPEFTPMYNVVVFNLPLAPSPFQRTRKDTPAYSFKFIASELKKVMDTLSIDKAHVIGESFGGVVAQQFTIDHPDAVDRLVVLSSLAKTDMPPIIAFKANYLLPAVRGLGLLFPGAAQTLFAHLHVGDVIEPHEPKWVKDFFKKEASWAHHYSVMARLSIVIPLDILEKVKAIKHPTLLLYGKDDHFTGKDSLILNKAIPNSRMVGLPGGHLPHLTNPKSFAAEVQAFLKPPPPPPVERPGPSLPSSF